MRRLLPLLFCLLSLATPTWGALAVANCANNATTTGAAVTVTLTTSAGSLIVVYCKQNVNSTSTVTMTDSNGGNTWSQTAGGYATSGSGTRAGMFFVPNATATTTVTCTWSASISGRIGAVECEVTGAATSTPEDGTSVNSSGTGSSTGLTSGSRSTTNANDILFYGTSVTTTLSGVTAGAGFNFPTNSIAVRVQLQNEIVTSTFGPGTTTTTWTSATTNREGIFAAFKAAAGGGSTTDIPHQMMTGIGD